MKQLMKVLATVSLLGVTSSLLAALPEPPDPREVSKMTFEQADKDKDGTLDREEAKLVCGEKFDVMDANKDGLLGKDEVNACGRKMGDKHGKLHAKRSKEFNAADKDADGTLTKGEAKSLKKVYENFDAIDVDKDGTVSREEVHNFMHK